MSLVPSLHTIHSDLHVDLVRSEWLGMKEGKREGELGEMGKGIEILCEG